VYTGYTESARQSLSARWIDVERGLSTEELQQLVYDLYQNHPLELGSVSE